MDFHALLATNQASVPEHFKHLLKKNQIHLISSTQDLAQVDKGLGTTIGSEALIARYPCKVRGSSLSLLRRLTCPVDSIRYPESLYLHFFAAQD